MLTIWLALVSNTWPLTQKVLPPWQGRQNAGITMPVAFTGKHRHLLENTGKYREIELPPCI